MKRRSTRRILVGIRGLLLLVAAACSDDGPADPADECVGRVVGTPIPFSSGGVPEHGHHTFSLCESDRGRALEFELSGATHTHMIDLTAETVGEILDGTTTVSSTGASAGHAHFVDYSR